MKKNKEVPVDEVRPIIGK
jgi:hypothetical protein